MAVSKNPDFLVWAGDVWHWARRPPGIYFCIIGGLTLALGWSLSQSKRLVHYDAGPQQVVMAPPIAPIRRLPPAPSNTCAPDQVERYGRCIDWAPGVQNGCAPDWIYVDSVNGCVSVEMTNGRFKIYPGNYFQIAGKRKTTITLIEGEASADDPRTSLLITPLNPITFTGPWTISSPAGARIAIHYE